MTTAYHKVCLHTNEKIRGSDDFAVAGFKIFDYGIMANSTGRQRLYKQLEENRNSKVSG